MSVAFRLALEWIVAGSRARWLIVGFGLCTILPWFFACPILRPNQDFLVAQRQHWSAVVQAKVDHPLYDYTHVFAPESHEAKRNFRLLVPGLAHLAGGSFAAVEFIRFALQAAMIVALLLVAERATGDRAAALGVALAVAGTQIGTEVWWDSFYWFDNCAHACVVFALLARNPWLAGAAASAGLFGDERVLCSLPLVALFHFVTQQTWRPALGLAIGALVYGAVRLALSLTVGLGNPLAGVAERELFAANLTSFPVAFWAGLEGGWLLLLLAGRVHGPLRLARNALFAATLLVLLASMLVADFSRSATYALPATLTAAALVARQPDLGPNLLRYWAGAAAAVSLLVPNGVVIRELIVFEASLPSRLIQAWLRHP